MSSRGASKPHFLRPPSSPQAVDMEECNLRASFRLTRPFNFPWTSTGHLRRALNTGPAEGDIPDSEHKLRLPCNEVENAPTSHHASARVGQREKAILCFVLPKTIVYFDDMKVATKTVFMLFSHLQPLVVTRPLSQDTRRKPVVCVCLVGSCWACRPTRVNAACHLCAFWDAQSI